MSNCSKCIHEPVCYKPEMKETKVGKSKCRFYRNRLDITFKIIKFFQFISVLVAIKVKECRHLCITCEYRETCFNTIKDEIKHIE